MKRSFLFTVIIAFALISFSQKPAGTKSIAITNDATPSSKKGYYNWAVYVAAHPDTLLKKISQVTYTFHSSFKQPVQTVNYKQSNVFRYCASGWGEFLIKVKIIFYDKKRKPLDLNYQLNFRSKTTKYICK